MKLVCSWVQRGQTESSSRAAWPRVRITIKGKAEHGARLRPRYRFMGFARMYLWVCHGDGTTGYCKVPGQGGHLPSHEKHRSRIGRYLSVAAATRLVHAFATSRLDCNINSHVVYQSHSSSSSRECKITLPAWSPEHSHESAPRPSWTSSTAFLPVAARIDHK